MSNTEQVLGWLQLSKRWAGLCEEFEQDRAVVRLAHARGLVVDAEWLQTAVNAYRKTRGLVSAEDTSAWLEAKGLGLEDLELFVTSALLRESLEASLTEDELLAFAEAQGGALDCVRISVIESATAAAARANLDALRSGADFEAVARERSTDGTSGTVGGHLEWFARRDLPPPFVGPVFDAAPGSVVGPIAYGARWYLVRCDEGPVPPTLHRLDRLRAQVVAHLAEQAR